MVRAFDLKSTLRARPYYQLSADIYSHKAGTKRPNKLPLYLVWPQFFFFKSTTFVMRSRGEPLSATLTLSKKLFLKRL